MIKTCGEDLDEIYGGTNINGPFISAFTGVIKVLFDAGHAVGSSIRRIVDKDLCPIK